MILARDRLGIKPLYLAETPGRLRFASTLPALLAAGDVDTSIDRVALHHYMSFHSVVPGPAHDPHGVRKLPPATVRVIEPDGTARRHAVLVAGLPARPRAGGHGPRRTGRTRCWRRCAPRWSGAWSPTCRSGCCCPAASTRALVVALLAEAGPAGLTTFSIGFESAGGESGDEFEYSDLDRQALRHRPPPDPDRLVAAAARLCRQPSRR